MESKELEIKNESLLTVQGFLNVPKVKGYLDNVLKERAGQFITSLVSLVNLETKLQKCKPKSIMMCGLKATSLNLPLDNNLGFAYVVPYGHEAQFQIGYKGFIQLAMRTGQYRSINVIDIREGELTIWDALTETLTLHNIDDEKTREKAPIIGYAAMYELKNGFRKVIYRKKESLLAHGKRFSKAFTSGPWQSDTDAMCRKTLLKELLSKWGPLSTDIMEGIKADQAIIRDNETTGEQFYDYADADVESEIVPITYDIPEKDLAFIEDCFNTLEVNQAERAMKLAGCKGKPEEVTKLIAELKEKIVHKKAEEKGETKTEGISPHADELFGKDKGKKK